MTPKSDIGLDKKMYIECVIFGAFYYVFTHKRRNTYCKKGFNLWFKQYGANGSQYFFDETCFFYHQLCPQTFLRLPEYLVETGKEKKKDLKIIVSESNPLLNRYGWYIEHAVEYYSLINTILSPFNPIDFYSVYITCSVSTYDPKSRKGKEELADTPTPKVITDTYGHRVSLIADGGYGKTLFLKHMLLCDKRYGKEGYIDKSELIPVLVNLNDYKSDKYENIETFVYRQVSRFDGNITFDMFLSDLKEGIFLFLFDALDEIGEKDIMTFINAINDFCSRYDKNYFIVSSRPSDSCAMLQSFKFLQLMPFDKDKARRLIQKFDSYDQKIRNEFTDKFGYHLTEIERNPLLLTIKFMVFANKKEFVDGDSYKFYQKAYETLYETHDQIDSHYRRPFKTNLNINDFEKVMAEFCYSLFMSYDFSFDRETAENVFENLNLENKYNITLDDFLDDFKDNLCLIYIENDSYHFIHRSFQEYFTARFLIKQNADFLKNEDFNKRLDEYGSPKFTVSKKSEDGVADGLIFFEKSPLVPVFSFMMQMKPTKLVNNILLPKLKGIFGYYKEPCSIGDYLEKVYGNIYYTIGDVEGALSPELKSDILSFIYSEICKESYDYHDLMELDVPKEFEFDVQYRVIDTNNDTYFVSEHDMDFGDTKEEDKPLPAGKIYEIPVSKLRANTPKYGDLLEQIYEEFKDEYAAFLKAYVILVEKYPR